MLEEGSWLSSIRRAEDGDEISAGVLVMRKWRIISTVVRGLVVSGLVFLLTDYVYGHGVSSQNNLRVLAIIIGVLAGLAVFLFNYPHGAPVEGCPRYKPRSANWTEPANTSSDIRMVANRLPGARVLKVSESAMSIEVGSYAIYGLLGITFGPKWFPMQIDILVNDCLDDRINIQLTMKDELVVCWRERSFSRRRSSFEELAFDKRVRSISQQLGAPAIPT
ncbi:MAG: hypothetical protein ACYDEP_10700 [Acidimicrobiales bacterium]